MICSKTGWWDCHPVMSSLYCEASNPSYGFDPISSRMSGLMSWMAFTSRAPSTRRGEQRLPGELDCRVELVIGIGLLREAVALVVGHDEPHRRVALLQRLHDLQRLGVGHA